MRSMLHRRGVRFRVRRSLELGGLRTTPDMAISALRLALYIDGCFWHGCPLHGTVPSANHGYWGPKLRRNVERDRAVDAALAAEGWIVRRVWEHDVADATADLLAREIHARRRAEASCSAPRGALCDAQSRKSAGMSLAPATLSTVLPCPSNPDPAESRDCAIAVATAGPLSRPPQASALKPTAEGDWLASIEAALGVRGDASGRPDAFGVALRAAARARLSSPIRTLSLFSGGGGLDIGFHDAGFATQAFVELEPRHVATLRANCGIDRYFQAEPPIPVDIRELDTRTVPPVSFVIGGPPCQSFSAAGRRAAGVRGTSDPRGGLFREYIRVIGKLRPAGFLFENVGGLLGAQHGRAWQRVRVGFEALGYTIRARVLDAADYGVPQHRERLIVVGMKGRAFRFPRPTHGPDSRTQRPYYPAGAAVAGAAVNGVTAPSGRYGHLLGEVPPGLNYSYFTEEMGHPRPFFAWRSKFSDFLYKADPARPTRTLKARSGQFTGPFHWESRTFSIAELKRLQTIPDSYELVGARRTAMEEIGNSVPPQLARIMAIAVLDQAFGTRLGDLPLDYLSDEEPLRFRSRRRSITRQNTRTAAAALAVRSGDEASATVPPAPALELPSLTTGTLGPDFGWAEGHTSLSPGHRQFSVSRQVVGGELEIRVEALSARAPIAEHTFELRATPANRWAVRWPAVRLAGPARDAAAFSAVWKAWERTLAESGCKADLVQLCGYYQYAPRFVVEPSRFGPFRGRGAPEWRALASILEGACTRELVPLPEFADRLGLQREQCARVLLFLRSLGYEIRARSTNPQIPRNWILIPYAFPTLSPQSVQAWKELRLLPASTAGRRHRARRRTALRQSIGLIR